MRSQPTCPAHASAVPGVDSHDPRFASATVIVMKHSRRVGLYVDGALTQIDAQPACWPIALAADYAPGTKEREGDRRTPEGWYQSSDKPTSSFYGAIAVHYPNHLDAAAGLQDGLIDEATHADIVHALDAGLKPPQATPLGGEILIHGGGAGSDWTLGCIAMDNPDLDALRLALPTPIAADILVVP